MCYAQVTALSIKYKFTKDIMCKSDQWENTQDQDNQHIWMLQYKILLQLFKAHRKL
jgi:hypothetical protein